MNKLIPSALFLLFFSVLNEVDAQISTSNGNGDWNNPATWSPVGVPPINNNVVIRASDSVWVNNPTQIVADVTVNGILAVNNLASSDLTFDGHLTVNGKLYNNGYIEMVTMGKNFVMGANSYYQHNPRNDLNIQLFSRGVENFAPTSTLVIMKWDDENIPLGATSRVTSDFGNVVLSYNSATVWEQRGRFGPPGNANRVKGSFTVTTGMISMDDGTSSPTTALTLQTVLITGSSQIVFQKGLNRNLVLITGSFTDNSTNPLPTVIMQNSYGALNWTVNGNLNISHPFIGIEGTSNENATGRLTVNGNFNITGGSFEYCTRVNALTEITVTGNTTISGPVTKVRFNDGNNLDMNFITNDFIVSSCNDIVLLGGNYGITLPGGTPTVTVNNDFLIDGDCSITILDSTASTRKTRVVIARDLISNSPNANLKLANNQGAVTLRVGRHLTYTGGNFIGQANNNSTGIDSIIVIGNFAYNTSTPSNYFRANYGVGNTFLDVNGNMSVLNSGTANNQGISLVHIPTTLNMGVGQLNVTIGGTYLQNGGRFVGINRGAGALTFNCTAGLLDMNAGVFMGINNLDTIASGAATYNLLGIDYDGGVFIAHNGSTTAGPVLNVSVTNNCKINYTSVTDQFRFIGLFLVQTSINILPLNLSVGGNMTFSGVNGSFISSHSAGTETITITGNLTVSAGTNHFNVFPNSGYQTNGHLVNMVVNGQVSVTGGLITLCAELGTLNATFNQNLTVSNGDFVLKSGFGSGTLNINGGFNQTGGIVELYKNTAFTNNLVVAMVVNADNDAVGDFSQTGGTLSFSDNSNPSSGENLLSVKSPNFTIGGNGIITSAGTGSSFVLGIIDFSRTGTTIFSRGIGSSHNVTQSRYIVSAGTTVDVTTGNMQLASHNNNAIIDMLKINGSGILWLRGSNQIYSNGTYSFCNIQTFNFSRIRIENPNGLYNGTNTAALNANNNLNFALATGNFIEYRGTANQIVTGLGVGVATLPQHKYGGLEINHQGTPGINYVYPAADLSVFIKYQLILTQGEFNLDPDNNPSTLNGRAITVESASTAAVSRTTGYIKSETRDGSAAIRWFMGSTAGTRTIPFGYDPANYIPFKLTTASGTVDTVTMATYRTPAPDNLPFPPSVSHLNDLAGIDNSLQTVDRFWLVNVKGSVASVNYEFTYVPVEASLLAGSPRAQKWMMPISLGWTFPYPGTQSNVVNGVVANGITNKSGWWTLSSITSPLPVELLGFDVDCRNNEVNLEWTVASEKENSHFTLLKSYNGKDFLKLTSIEGRGNSSSIAIYAFSYKEEKPGLCYYKLLQTDFNGTVTDLKTIAFNGCISKDIFTVQVFGNQALINVPYEGDYKMIINDASGRMIDIKQLMELRKGLNTTDLNFNRLADGVYFIRVTALDGSSAVSKFIISR